MNRVAVLALLTLFLAARAQDKKVGVLQAIWNCGRAEGMMKTLHAVGRSDAEAETQVVYLEGDCVNLRRIVFGR